jgi:cytochrome c oxidase cbb3-type subunit 2
MKALVAGGLLVVALGAGFALKAERLSDQAATDRGRQVYLDNCAACHGTRGDGRGMAAHMFRTPPRDLRSGLFAFRSTPSGTLPTDTDLLRRLEAGIRTTAMISHRHLSEVDRRAVVAYVKTLSPRFAAEGSGHPIAIPPEPQITPELVRRGARVYEDAECGKCHGPQGRGNGPSAPDLKDQGGRPIGPTDLTRLPYKRGQEPEELYKTIATGLDGTPMPSFGDSLMPDDIWALVAYLRSLPPASAWANLDAPVGEERAGIMVERMHGTLGGGMMRRMPMGPGMMERMEEMMRGGMMRR